MWGEEAKSTKTTGVCRLHCVRRLSLQRTSRRTGSGAPLLIPVVFRFSRSLSRSCSPRRGSNTRTLFLTRIWLLGGGKEVQKPPYAPCSVLYVATLRRCKLRPLTNTP